MPCEVEAMSAQAMEQPPQALDLPEGVPPLTSLYLYISGSCNLACRHCWISPTYQTDNDDGHHVDFEYVRKALHEAKPLGLQSVKLTGGEPTLHPQFQDIVDLINKEKLRINIETNGILLDGTLAKFLKKKRVSFVSVSVDGASAETHEYLRGVSGCYEKAIKGINALVNAGFRPQLICTLYKGNVSQMNDVVALAESLGCGSVKFNHVQNLGRGKSFADEQGFEVLELLQLYHHVENKLVKQSKVRIHFDIPIAFHSIRRLINDPLSRCMVRNILSMLAGGELSLCGIGVTVPELTYGNLEDNSLREVWCDSPGLVQLRRQIPDQLEGICKQCLYKNFCLGYCVANNFHATGTLTAPYEFCDRAETLGAFPASRKILAENGATKRRVNYG